MIYYVSGSVSILEPGLAVIDCGGVGYGCRISAYTSAQLKLNTTARLFVTESIREDAHDLYGFISKEEQRCFELLTAINGVGPKAALSILSAGGPQNFTLAVMTGDEKMLVAAQGVGKKLAQRIILELKDKVGGSSMELDFSAGVSAAVPQGSGNLALATAALQELGYSPSEINAALKGVDPEQLGGSVVIALVVEPGGRQIGGQVARVGMVAEVEVNRRGDDEHVAHHAVLNRGAGAAGADDVGVAEIKAIIHQDGLKGHRAVDLAHAGHAEGDAILDVQRVRAADDIVALAALAIALIVILSLAGEIAGHFAAFELRQDQRLDGDGLGQREGRADDEQSGNEQSKQFLHG